VRAAVDGSQRSLALYGSFGDGSFHYDPRSGVVLSDVDLYAIEGSPGESDLSQIAQAIGSRIAHGLGQRLHVSVRPTNPFAVRVRRDTNVLLSLAEAAYQSVCVVDEHGHAATRFYHILKMAIRIGLTSQARAARRLKTCLPVMEPPPYDVLLLDEVLDSRIASLTMRRLLDKKIVRREFVHLHKILGMELSGHDEIRRDISRKIGELIQRLAQAEDS